MNSNTKKSKIITIILVLISILLFISFIIYAIYKSTVDISTKNDDKFDYVLAKEYDNSEYNYLDFLSYDLNKTKDLINIKIPKTYLYENIIDIKSLTKQLEDNYNLKITRIGALSNLINNNYIDFYLDGLYSNNFKLYITGVLEYKVTNNNGLQVLIKEINIGDGLPSFIYKGFIPLKQGDILYEIDPNKYSFLKDYILDLNLIKNVKMRKNYLMFDFDYMSNIENITKYIFKDEKIILNDALKSIMPVIIDTMLNNENQENNNLLDEILPMIFGDNQEIED